MFQEKGGNFVYSDVYEVEDEDFDWNWTLTR